MKKRYHVILFAMAAMLCMNIMIAYADTDGTELQVAVAETLEVRLGEEWAGVQFQLQTDAGIYPDMITVGDDGILRLELGGSSSYTLTRLTSAEVVMDYNDEAAGDMGTGNVKDSDEKEKQNEENTIAGIPILHLILFVGGMLVAIVALMVLKFNSRNREADSDDYDES